MCDSDLDMMKERFSKLLLGEDMSGAGKGVSSAMALSNAITNLAGMRIVLHLVRMNGQDRVTDHVHVVFWEKRAYCAPSIEFLQLLCLENRRN